MSQECRVPALLQAPEGFNFSHVQMFGLKEHFFSVLLAAIVQGSPRVLGGTYVGLEACLVHMSSCRLETFQILIPGGKSICTLVHPMPH